MKANVKDYIYNKAANPVADRELEQAVRFGNVKLGRQFIFWKSGLRQYMIPIEEVQRAYRRVEEVASKICCGNVNFDTEKLVLILKNDAVLEIRIGDGTRKEAEELYQSLQREHPELQYGKETRMC